MYEAKDYETLTVAPYDCPKCSELCRIRENVVNGERLRVNPLLIAANGGPYLPLVMGIGRNPGKNEDLEGRPFVGRAGKVLRRIVLPVENVECRWHWTNQVKCYTPGDREPTEEEIDNCLPYMAQELELVKPDAIVLFGLTVQRVWGFKKEERSIVRVINGVPVISTYHPSFAARGNKEAEEVIVKDIWTAIRLGREHLSL